ncbi:MAG: G1 family glutamic endopeptidase [Xanthobacteraceae bacterium]
MRKQAAQGFDSRSLRMSPTLDPGYAAGMMGKAIAVTLAVLASANPASAFSAKSAKSWSGYVVSGTTFTAVYGAWKQPIVTCPTADARASFWIGIDGWGTGSVEQVGTWGVCSGVGKPVSYHAFWEIVGGGGKQPFAVAPGDSIEASVTFTGDAYALVVKDLTTKAQFVTQQKCGSRPCSRATAEWIVERPGGHPMAQYQEMVFSGLSVTAAMPPNGGITVTQVTMKNGNNVLSACSLPANSSASKPPANIDCKWSGAQ